MYSLWSWWVNNKQSNINQTSIKPKGFRASWLVWWTKTEVRPGSSLNSENQNHFVNKFKDVTWTDSWTLFNKISIENKLARTIETLLWSDRLFLPKRGSYKQNEILLQRFTRSPQYSNGNSRIKTYGTSRLVYCEPLEEPWNFSGILSYKRVQSSFSRCVMTF